MQMEGGISLTTSVFVDAEGTSNMTPMVMIFLDDQETGHKTTIRLNLEYAKEFSTEIQNAINAIESQYEYYDLPEEEEPVDRTKVEIIQEYRNETPNPY